MSAKTPIQKGPGAAAERHEKRIMVTSFGGAVLRIGRTLKTIELPKLLESLENQLPTTCRQDRFISTKALQVRVSPACMAGA
jgi:hypothetical protein